MANDERTFPSTMGFSHLSFCAGVPSFFSTFMLPSSGAMQLNASGPNSERAASSYITAPGHHRQVHPAVFLRRLRRPEAGLLGLLANRIKPLVGNILVLGEIHWVGFERQHVLLDEGAGADAQTFDLGRQCEVHEFPLPP